MSVARITKKTAKRLRAVIGWMRRRPTAFWAVILFVGMLGAYTIHTMNQQLPVDPISTKPLLDLIANAEYRTIDLFEGQPVTGY